MPIISLGISRNDIYSYMENSKTRCWMYIVRFEGCFTEICIELGQKGLIPTEKQTIYKLLAVFYACKSALNGIFSIVTV